MNYSEFLEQRRELIAQVIHEGYRTLTVEPGEVVQDIPLTLNDIITNGESSEVEYKSTLRMNLHTGNRDTKMELAVLKTIAGFLNSKGGILTIGVADDGTPLGIDADGFENEDKMSLHLVNLTKERISPSMMQFIHARFEDYDSCRVMVIECSKAKSPAFVKDGNIERFYIRTGPSTTELSASQTQEYIKQRYTG
jgi:predicted HTH transcriptional regulator